MLRMVSEERKAEMLFWRRSRTEPEDRQQSVHSMVLGIEREKGERMTESELNSTFSFQ